MCLSFVEVHIKLSVLLPASFVWTEKEQSCLPELHPHADVSPIYGIYLKFVTRNPQKTKKLGGSVSLFINAKKGMKKILICEYNM